MNFKNLYLNTIKYIKRLWHKMSTLDKYMIKQVLEVFLMGIIVFTSIMFATEAFLSIFKKITELGVPLNIALVMILLNLPTIIVMSIPMGMLFATVMTVNKLCTSSELTVMRACGISINRIAKPIFIFALIMTTFSFIINETVSPKTTEQSKILGLWSLGQRNVPEEKTNFTFKEVGNDHKLKRLFYIQNCKDKKFKNVTVLDFSKENTIQILHSKNGGVNPKGWQFKDAVTYNISKDKELHNTTLFDNTIVDFGLNLSDEISKENAEQYNFIALIKHLKQKKYDKKEKIKMQIQLYNKIALPFTTIAFALIGVPLAITPPRVRYNRGLLFCIMIIFIFYILQTLAAVLGENQIISPYLAAWLPNIIIILWGGILYYKKVYTIS